MYFTGTSTSIWILHIYTTLCIKYCYMCLLVSQFLDINWTGLTNMLDIPGIKWVIHVSAITHHLIILCQFHKTGEWIRQPLKCTRAVTWPILYFEVAQITVSHTTLYTLTPVSEMLLFLSDHIRRSTFTPTCNGGEMMGLNSVFYLKVPPVIP